jgi:phenylacetate-CoA ligase
VVAQDGTVLHGLGLIYILRDLPQVRAFKIVQEDLNLTHVFVVPEGELSVGLIEKIKADFRFKLGQGVTIIVDQVAEIPAEKSGKFRYVVSKVGHA